MYDYATRQEQINIKTEIQTANDKLDVIHEDLQSTNLFFGATLIMLIVCVLLSIIKS